MALTMPGARALRLIAVAGLAAGMLAVCVRPAAAASCPTVDPTTHQVSPAPVPNSDWYGCDLGNADLNGANLSGDDLTATDFVGADLTDADLSGVVSIYTANFSDAVMAGVRSGGIPSQEAFLPTGWFLVNGGYPAGPGANMSGQRVYATFTTIDMTGADFSGANVSEAGFGVAPLVMAVSVRAGEHHRARLPLVPR